MRYRLLMLSGLLMLGCDRSPTAAPVDSGALQGVLRLSTVTPLQPNRLTHVAVDALGNVYWVQESDAGGNDVLFSLGEGAVPQATRLTAANILAAINARGGSGNIQSIAAASNQEGIFFYFSGGKEARVLACIGWFSPRTQEIRILCDTQTIQSASNMVASLALARGTLVTGHDSPQMWLWLNHDDGSAFLKFVSRPVAQAMKLELQRPFNAVTHEGRKLIVVGESHRLGATAAGELILADLVNGALWRINPTSGSATLAWSLVGLPRDMSAPAALADGRIMIFAADSPVIQERAASQIAQPVITTSYPALLFFGEREISAIPRDRIRAYAEFPVYRLNLRSFVAEPSGKSWVTYDNHTGELLRGVIE